MSQEVIFFGFLCERGDVDAVAALHVDGPHGHRDRDRENFWLLLYFPLRGHGIKKTPEAKTSALDKFSPNILGSFSFAFYKRVLTQLLPW